jgi:hypothetical protein
MIAPVAAAWQRLAINSIDGAAGSPALVSRALRSDQSAMSFRSLPILFQHKAAWQAKLSSASIGAYRDV